MKEEQTQVQAKSNGIGIKANTLITVLFGLLLSAASLINNLQNKAAHDDTMAAMKDLKLEVVNSYVSKTDFQTAVTALTTTDSKLWEKEAGLSDTMSKSLGDINLKMQHIEDSMGKK